MTREDITNIIEQLLRKWDKLGYSPQAINNGNCEEFAMDIQEIAKTGQVIWGEDYPELFKTNVDKWGHCFYRFRGYCFDSETIKGVKNPDNLKYYLRSKKYFENHLTPI